MSARLLGYLIGAVLFLAYSGGVFYLGDQHAKSAMDKAVIKAGLKQDKEVAKIQEQQAKREIVYVDRLKVVHDAKDNCLDQPVPVNILSTLRSSP